MFNSYAVENVHYALIVWGFENFNALCFNKQNQLIMDIGLIVSTNWLAMLVGALSTFVLGCIWYNPKVFGTAWMKGVSMTDEDAKKGNMPMVFGVSFLMSFVLAYHCAQYPHGEWYHGAVHGLIYGFSLIVPVVVTSSLYEQKSWTVIFINVGYGIVALCVMGIIVYTMGEMPDYPELEEMSEPEARQGIIRNVGVI